LGTEPAGIGPVSNPYSQSLFQIHKQLKQDRSDFMPKFDQNLGEIVMCHDMRRFEKMAEEKKRANKQNKIDFVVSETEEIQLTSKNEVKENART